MGADLELSASLCQRNKALRIFSDAMMFSWLLHYGKGVLFHYIHNFQIFLPSLPVMDSFPPLVNGMMHGISFYFGCEASLPGWHGLDLGIASHL